MSVRGLPIPPPSPRRAASSGVKPISVYLLDPTALASDLQSWSLKGQVQNIGSALKQLFDYCNLSNNTTAIGETSAGNTKISLSDVVAMDASQRKQLCANQARASLLHLLRTRPIELSRIMDHGPPNSRLSVLALFIRSCRSPLEAKEGACMAAIEGMKNPWTRFYAIADHGSLRELIVHCFEKMCLPVVEMTLLEQLSSERRYPMQVTNELRCGCWYFEVMLTVMSTDFLQHAADIAKDAESVIKDWGEFWENSQSVRRISSDRLSFLDLGDVTVAVSEDLRGQCERLIAVVCPSCTELGTYSTDSMVVASMLITKRVGQDGAVLVNAFHRLVGSSIVVSIDARTFSFEDCSVIQLRTFLETLCLLRTLSSSSCHHGAASEMLYTVSDALNTSLRNAIAVRELGGELPPALPHGSGSRCPCMGIDWVSECTALETAMSLRDGQIATSSAAGRGDSGSTLLGYMVTVRGVLTATGNHVLGDAALERALRAVEAEEARLDKSPNDELMWDVSAVRIAVSAVQARVDSEPSLTAVSDSWSKVGTLLSAPLSHSPQRRLLWVRELCTVLLLITPGSVGNVAAGALERFPLLDSSQEAHQQAAVLTARTSLLLLGICCNCIEVTDALDEIVSVVRVTLSSGDFSMLTLVLEFWKQFCHYSPIGVHYAASMTVLLYFGAHLALRSIISSDGSSLLKWWMLLDEVDDSSFMNDDVCKRIVNDASGIWRASHLKQRYKSAAVSVPRSAFHGLLSCVHDLVSAAAAVGSESGTVSRVVLSLVDNDIVVGMASPSDVAIESLIQLLESFSYGLSDAQALKCICSRNVIVLERLVDALRSAGDHVYPILLAQFFESASEDKAAVQALREWQGPFPVHAVRFLFRLEYLEALYGRAHEQQTWTIVSAVEAQFDNTNLTNEFNGPSISTLAHEHCFRSLIADISSKYRHYQST